MSCLSVIIQRIGSTTKKPTGYDGLRARVSRQGAMAASFVGLVCPTDLDNRVGILWASDGRLITLEGGFLIPNGR